MSKLPKKQKYFTEWEKATDQLALQFAMRYFGKDGDSWWVCGEIGGCFVINDDYFFSVGYMADFLRFNYTRKDMFAYYDYALKCRESYEYPVNIKAWRNLW